MTLTGAYITAIDYALPGRQVNNNELADLHPEWHMDQVVLHAGVEQRYWCNSDETALDLAEIASRKLITRLDLDPTQIDAILFCTQSPDHIMPPNACLLQSRLGLSEAVAAFDFSLACSGFIYGLYLAKALSLSGLAKQILLITAETYSKWMHPGDRGPMTLFGDGAAATLISAGREGIGEFALRTNGSEAACFMIPAGGARQPKSAETAKMSRDIYGNTRSAENIHMNGAVVLDFVKKDIPPLVRNLLRQANLTLDDFDLILFHQASQLTLDFLHKALNIPENKRFSNLAQVGNTVSASIPILLRDAEQQGVLKPGMRIMLVGFGVGLSWGGCIVDW